MYIWCRYSSLLQGWVSGWPLDLRATLNCLSTKLVLHLILGLLLQCLPGLHFLDSFHLQILLLLQQGLYLFLELVYDFQYSHFVFVDIFNLISFVHLILFEIHLPCCAEVIQKLLYVLQERLLADGHIFGILILISIDVYLVFIFVFFWLVSPPVFLWTYLFQYDLLSRQFGPLYKREYFVHQVLFQGLILDVIHLNQLINLLKVLVICLNAFVLDDLLQHSASQAIALKFLLYYSC